MGVKTHRRDHGKCPTCAAKLDASSGEGSRSPNPGDYSICVYCLEWLIYNDDITLRVLRQEDVDSMTNEEAVTLREFTIKFEKFKGKGK